MKSPVKPFGEVSNYNMNKVIPVIYFFLGQLWSFESFKDLVHFIHVGRFVSIKLLIFPNYPISIYRSCSDDAALILDTSNMSFFFQPFCLKYISIKFKFSKRQILVPLIFLLFFCIQLQ